MYYYYNYCKTFSVYEQNIQHEILTSDCSPFFFEITKAFKLQCSQIFFTIIFMDNLELTRNVHRFSSKFIIKDITPPILNKTFSKFFRLLFHKRKITFNGT